MKIKQRKTLVLVFSFWFILFADLQKIVIAQTQTNFSMVISRFNNKMKSYGEARDKEDQLNPPSALRKKEDSYLSDKFTLDRTTPKHIVVIDPLFFHVEEFPSKLSADYQEHYFSAFSKQRAMNFYGTYLLGKMLFPELPSPIDNEIQIREDFISGNRSDPFFIGIQLYTEVKSSDLGVTSQFDMFHNNNKSLLTPKLYKAFPESFRNKLRFLNQGRPTEHYNFLDVFSEFHYNGLSNELTTDSPYTPFWLETMEFRFGQSFWEALEHLAFSEMLEKLGFSDGLSTICVVGSEIPFILADGYANWMSFLMTGRGGNCRRPQIANILNAGTYASPSPKETTNTRKRKYFERTGTMSYGRRQRDLVLIELEKTQAKAYQYGDYKNSVLLSALRADFHLNRYDESQNVFAWTLVDFLIRGHFQNEPNLHRFRDLLLNLREFFQKTKQVFPKTTDKKSVQNVRAMYQLLRILELFGEPGSMLPEFKNTDFENDLDVLSQLRRKISSFEVKPEEIETILRDESVIAPIHRVSGYLAWVHKRWAVQTYTSEVNNEKLDSNYFKALGTDTPPAPPKKRSRRD